MRSHSRWKRWRGWMVAALVGLFVMAPHPLQAEEVTMDDLKRALEEKDQQMKALMERVERLEQLTRPKQDAPSAQPSSEAPASQASSPPVAAVQAPEVTPPQNAQKAPAGAWPGLRLPEERGGRGKGVKFAIPPLGGDVKIKGDYWLMGFHWNTPYFGNPVFGEQNFSWAEQFGRLRADFETEDQTFGLSLAANYGMTLNEDAYGGPFLASVFGSDNFRERFALDIAHVRLRRPFGLPAEFTLGRQVIQIADQFVVGIGELSDAAIWLIPIQSFPVAFRGLWDLPSLGPIGELKLDTFVARTDPKSGAVDVVPDPTAPLGLVANRRNAGRDGTFYGVNVHWAFRNIINGDFAYFDFEDDKALVNTRAPSFRLGLPKLFLPFLSLSGEVAPQFGDAGVGIDRAALGFHIDLKATFQDLPLKPSLLVRYTSYSGDDPTTADENEAYDPLFFGFPDFGTWVQGEITGEYILFNFNERIIQALLELHPSEKLLLRFFYYHFWLDEPETFVGTAAAGQANFIDELNVAVQYAFTKEVTFVLLGAVAFPARGAIQAFEHAATSGLVESLFIVSF